MSEMKFVKKVIRNTPLTKERKEDNLRKSKILCRIEHVFGFMTTSMNGLTVCSIGLRRATFNIGVTNFVYNFCRYSFLCRMEVANGNRKIFPWIRWSLYCRKWRIYGFYLDELYNDIIVICALVPCHFCLFQCSGNTKKYFWFVIFLMFFEYFINLKMI